MMDGMMGMMPGWMALRVLALIVIAAVLVVMLARGRRSPKA